MKRLAFIFLLLALAALLLALTAWSPWITPAWAEQRAVDGFSTAWQGVADGCGFNCQGCGAKEARRVPLGVAVELEYACGLLPEDSPEYHQRVEVFVSPLGTVHGVRGP